MTPAAAGQGHATRGHRYARSKRHTRTYGHEGPDGPSGCQAAQDIFTLSNHMGSLNDGLRFLLELALLASLAYWGFSEQAGVVQWVLGLGAPLLVAVVWGRFIAPKASHPTTDPLRVLLEVAVFAAGVAALFTADRTVLALVFAALVLVHLSLTFALDQRPR